MAEQGQGDKGGKGSKDDTFSIQPIEQDNTFKDPHKKTPGPVMAQNLPEAASKEELRKRAEELNKK